MRQDGPKSWFGYGGEMKISFPVGIQAAAINIATILTESLLFNTTAFLQNCRPEIFSILIRIGKHLSDSFPIQNGLKQFIAIAFQLCFRTCH
jgi:hypothetical protein